MWLSLSHNQPMRVTTDCQPRQRTSRVRVQEPRVGLEADSLGPATVLKSPDHVLSGPRQ